MAVVSLLFFFLDFLLLLLLFLLLSSCSTAAVVDGVLVFAGGPLGWPCTPNEVDSDDIDVSSNVSDTEKTSSKLPGWVMLP